MNSSSHYQFNHKGKPYTYNMTISSVHIKIHLPTFAFLKGKQFFFGYSSTIAGTQNITAKYY